ncbi:MAG: hypothetical protein WB760_30685 [Xanthobacteraceae bacterium]
MSVRAGKMKAGEVVSLQKMKARWVCSEIRSPRLAEHYQIDPRVPPLRAKIETAAFECLAASEIDALVEIFETYRGSYLSHYWADVREFVIEEWSADQLDRVYAMSEVDSSGEGRYRPFAVFAAAPRPTGPTAQIDPRVAADKTPLSTALLTPDPLVVGRYEDVHVLIDGYFRALVFMRSASPGERIAVLVPAEGWTTVSS